jgi:DNA-directed RNA polymerase subunit omega
VIKPRLDTLLERVDSHYACVLVAAKRARQINSYYNQLSEGLGTVVPPQVSSSARKPLSIAFEEIDADKILGVWPDPEAEGDAEAVEGSEPGA